MRAAIFLTALFAAGPAFAQHQGHGGAPPASQPATSAPAKPDDAMPAMAWPTEVPATGSNQGSMPGMDMSNMPGMDAGGADEEPVGTEPPPPAPTDHAADAVFNPQIMQRARDQLQKEHGGAPYSKVMLNLGEWQFRNGEDGYRWDGRASFGGDINRFVFKTEGDGSRRSGIETGEVQALYSRAISPFFDVQAGVRQDIQRGPRRTYAVLGLEGVAPYWFDVEGVVFLSNQGEVLGRVEGSYDLRLTQRFILQPRAEVNLAAQDVPDLRLGSGATNVEFGLRLRYDMRREFSPYVGISYDRKLGGTADFARARGEDPEAVSFVVGLRAWF